MNWFAIAWLAVIVVCLLLEAGTVSVVSIWFAVGALAALVASLCNGPLWLQIVLFVVVSTALLVALRPFVKKFLNPRLTKTNVDAVIGTEGVITQTVDNLAATGRVKLGAVEWAARSTTGVSLAPGTRVRADKIEGVKVFVTPTEISVH